MGAYGKLTSSVPLNGPSGLAGAGLDADMQLRPCGVLKEIQRHFRASQLIRSAPVSENIHRITLCHSPWDVSFLLLL